MFPKGRVLAMDLRIIARIPTSPLTVLQFAPKPFNGGNPAILIIATGVTTATQLSAMTPPTLQTSTCTANVTAATFSVPNPIRVRCLVL